MELPKTARPLREPIPFTSNSVKGDAFFATPSHPDFDCPVALTLRGAATLFAGGVPVGLVQASATNDEKTAPMTMPESTSAALWKRICSDCSIVRMGEGRCAQARSCFLRASGAEHFFLKIGDTRLQLRVLHVAQLRLD